MVLPSGCLRMAWLPRVPSHSKTYPFKGSYYFLTLEPGKAGDERAGEGRSFAGAEHDVEIGQRLCGGVFAGKRLAKELDLGARHEWRPIGAGPSHALPVVEDGDARHGETPLEAGSLAIRKSRTRRIADPRSAKPFHGARICTSGACARSADTSAG